MSIRHPTTDEPAGTANFRNAPFQLDLFGDLPPALPAAPPHPSLLTPASILIGCAGWNVPAAVAKQMPQQPLRPGSHLERYATVLPSVEINTAFYRPHLPATYARWRDSTPPGFRFSVKMPRTLTHMARLHDTDGNLDRFLAEIDHLGDKLGCILVQLPPTLAYDAFSAELFFDQLHRRSRVPVVCEPRHSSWFGDAAATMLSKLEIAYVRADPSPVTLPIPPGYDGVIYVRLHGSPAIYRSPYPPPFLESMAAELAGFARLGRTVWCIFDNTAEGHAMPNALALRKLASAIGREKSPPSRRRSMPR